jgi:protein-disulfide isomerase
MRVEPEVVANDVRSGAVRIAFHHVLDHGEASLNSSKAVECAAVQDIKSFWSMHGALFERQPEAFRGDEAFFADVAASVGLDGSALTACMEDPAIAAKVERMDAERRDLGVRRRPSFLVNERLVEGGLPYAQFAALFEEALH